MVRNSDAQPEIVIDEEELVIQTIERVFRELPLIYKWMVLSQDILLVIGGLKAGTHYFFLQEVFSEQEFQAFKDAFKSVGVEVSEPRFSLGENGNSYSGFIYDPTTLEDQTRDNDYAPQYFLGQSLEGWIEQAKEEKYLIGGVMGTLFSFPQSAIADFLTTDRDKDELKTASYGDEHYWYIPPAKNDVIEREQKKRVFLDPLLNSGAVKKIMSSEELKNSRAEWKKRISEHFKTSNSNNY